MLSFPRDLGYSRNDHISFASAPVTWALATFWTCVLSHLSQSNPRGREEMVCKSHVQPRLRVGSALWQRAGPRKSAEGGGGARWFCLQPAPWVSGDSALLPVSAAAQNPGCARWLSARHPALTPRPTPRTRRPSRVGAASSVPRAPATPREPPRPGARGGEPPAKGPRAHVSALPPARGRCCTVFLIL